MVTPRAHRRALRVLAVDHTAGVAPFRRKFAAIARRSDIELTVLAPGRWVENYRDVRLDVPPGSSQDGYQLRTGAVFWPGYENRAVFVNGLARAIRHVQPDILHLWEEPFSVMTLQALLLRRLIAPKSRALFFSSDNLTRNWRYPYRPSWFYARVERFAFRECAAGSAVSQDVERVLRLKGYRRHVEVIPHGLDLGDYSLDRGETPDERTSSGPVIGFVGRLLEQKGVGTLLRAFAVILSEHDADPRVAGGPPPVLVLVGDGPYAPMLQALARELGLGGRVQFRPAVAHDKVAPVYRSIDVLVVPSRTTHRWVEQFGRVLIEGMAAGCVVIGSSSGAIPSVIGDAGLVFPEDDVRALAAVLRRVLGDPGLSNELRARGLARVKSLYTWDAVADAVFRLYEKALDAAIPHPDASSESPERLE